MKDPNVWTENSCEQSGQGGSDSNELQKSSVWAEIAKDWPDPILLKDIGKLEGFPYSKGYIRNLVTGQTCESDLKASVFHIGKYPALRRGVMVGWLAGRTA
jgi:hypothetical protein